MTSLCTAGRPKLFSASEKSYVGYSPVIDIGENFRACLACCSRVNCCSAFFLFFFDNQFVLFASRFCEMLLMCAIYLRNFDKL